MRPPRVKGVFKEKVKKKTIEEGPKDLLCSIRGLPYESTPGYRGIINKKGKEHGE